MSMKPAEILANIREGLSGDVVNAIASYSQNPFLLDSILDESILLLAKSFIDKNNIDGLHVIYLFAITRGSKVIMQYLPTEVHYIPQVKANLESLENDWKSQYVLLLWLASLSLVPFELSLIQKDLFAQLYEIASSFLGYSGIQRDAGASLMSRLLTRGNATDNSQLISKFVTDNIKLIGPTKSSDSDDVDFKSLGVMQTLTICLDKKLPVFPKMVVQLVQDASELPSNSDSSQLWYYSNTILASLWVKLIGRCALQQLDAVGEFCIAECIALLDHSSTKVRTSAAKYLARIARKLDISNNKESADEIVWMVLNSLNATVSMESASPAYWNGTLLFFAELIRERKQLVLVNGSAQAMETLISKILNFMGLHFIQHPVNGQIGSNVRDSACYVCWSLFRYVDERAISEKMQETLFSSLIQLSCVDCDVSIRRAAAAALQEGLGRLKNPCLPGKGFGKMDILAKIGYRSVNAVEFCYNTLIPLFSFGLFELDQSPNILDLIIHHGLDNTNARFRRLASMCLARLVIDRPQIHHTVDKILDNSMLDVKGKLLALGYLSPKNYRTKDITELLSYEQDQSPLLLESSISVLHLIPYEAGANFLANAISTSTPENDPHLIHELRRTGSILTNSDDYNSRHGCLTSYLPVLKKKIRDHHLFVEFLVAIAEQCNTNRDDAQYREIEALLGEAAESSNPLSRSLVASRLELKDTSLITKYLSDYTVEKRGEVGAWVRESMLRRMLELNLKADHIDASIALPIWRMSAEPQAALRKLAAQCLFRDTNPVESPSYYCTLLERCPVEFHKHVARALSGTLAMYNAVSYQALSGLLQYLQQPGNTTWILKDIMSIDRNQLSRAIGVLRTLQQLVSSGYQFDSAIRSRVLAIAYNTTLEVRANSTLLGCAVDVLQYYAWWSVKARQRLVHMVQHHKVGLVRQRCADALFELGCEDDTLMETDWTVSYGPKNFKIEF